MGRPVARAAGAAVFRRCLLIVCVLCAGCKSMPAVDLEPVPAVGGVRVLDAGGTVTQHNSAHLISGAQTDDRLRYHLEFMEAQGGPPLIAGNQVRLLIDGPAAYSAMFGAIAQARHNINMEVYIFQDDSIGRDLAALLESKQRAGVQVNLIYDSLGCISTPASLFDRMSAAGVQVREFNPLGPDTVFDLNNRDHRKITVIDGSIAYTGGINISNVYRHGSAPSSGAAADNGWRDTQIEVRGPAAAEFQHLFFDTWRRLRGPELAGADYFPRPRAEGDKLVRVIGSSPGDDVNLIYVDLLSAIKHAQRSVHITMAYFVPDRRTLRELKRAARRGVDVSLILPGFSDIWVTLEAGRSYYGELLKSGVNIYERRDALLHSKTMVIDGVWSAVGSSNMDLRSFLHNNEVNALVLGDDFGAQMEAMFQQDLAQSQKITLEEWRDRPFGQKFREWFSRLWAYWL